MSDFYSGVDHHGWEMSSSFLADMRDTYAVFMLMCRRGIAERAREMPRKEQRGMKFDAPTPPGGADLSWITPERATNTFNKEDTS